MISPQFFHRMCVVVEIQTPTSGRPSTACVIAVCAAEILGLASYSIVPALLPQFIQAWSLSSTQAGWLAGSLFAGYMLAVVPLVTLTDRIPARTVYLACSALGALSALGVTLSDDLEPALVLCQPCPKVFRANLLPRGMAGGGGGEAVSGDADGSGA
jgi:MFS family permease